MSEVGEVEKLIAENNARLETINKLKALTAENIRTLETSIKDESGIEFCKDLDITRMSLQYLKDIKFLLSLFNEQFEVISLYRDKILTAAGYRLDETKDGAPQLRMSEDQMDEFKEQVAMKVEMWQFAKEKNPATSNPKYMNIFRLAKEPFKAEKRKIIDSIVKPNKSTTPKEADIEEEYEEEIEIDDTDKD